jgi:hypothetical protein
MKAVRAYEARRGPRPTYDLKILKACVQEGFYPGSSTPSTGLVAAEAQDNSSHRKPEIVVSHNHYGSESFLKKLLVEPHLLAGP